MINYTVYGIDEALALLEGQQPKLHRAVSPSWQPRIEYVGPCGGKHLTLTGISEHDYSDHSWDSLTPAQKHRIAADVIRDVNAMRADTHVTRCHACRRGE